MPRIPNYSKSPQKYAVNAMISVFAGYPFALPKFVCNETNFTNYMSFFYFMFFVALD